MNLFWLHTRLLIVAIIWGLGWTAGRVATDFPPITAAWIRYIIAVAMFLVWLKMTGNSNSDQGRMEAIVLHRLLLDLPVSSLLHVWNALHCSR